MWKWILWALIIAKATIYKTTVVDLFGKSYAVNGNNVKWIGRTKI